MRLITGYLQPDSGDTFIKSVSVADDPVRAQAMVGYLPEGAPLYPELTPTQLLKFTGRMHHLSRSYFLERFEHVVKQLSLQDVLQQPIDTLSKGFKRRVGLAQALLHDPPVLILDEPTDGLDPLQKHEVRKLIKQMSKDKAIIISTHILEEVDAVCTRLLIINHGSIVTEDTPPQLKRKYHGKDLDMIFRTLTRETKRK
jgi:ABC-2 type transport system ATP-binding protein